MVGRASFGGRGRGTGKGAVAPLAAVSILRATVWSCSAQVATRRRSQLSTATIVHLLRPFVGRTVIANPLLAQANPRAPLAPDCFS
jgi:hypothetical protein